MILFDIARTEANPIYQEMAISNVNRQYDFLRSIVLASTQLNQPLFNHRIIRALNFHAIVGLHDFAGEYRPCPVRVTHANEQDYLPPQAYEVPALMDAFVDEVNLHLKAMDPLLLATGVLWRLNHIHPFINGNGRTARACCYYLLCVKLGGWLPGSIILPELLVRERDEHVQGIKYADRTGDLSQLHRLVMRLLEEQLGSNGHVPSSMDNLDN